ncbi:cysteine proteinase [Backusella circina FSU 941]|nr:cysteine proteinase [Backusella circina FSU 941]
MRLFQLPQLSTFCLFDFLKKKIEIIGYVTQIAALDRYFRDKYWVKFSKKELLRFLKLSKGDLREAKREADEYQEGKSGILVSMVDHQVLLKGGVENHKNTSCYIDSLLFAMFIGLTGFDPLLLCETKESKVQDNIRLFINKLRKGQLIQEQTVRQLRKSLIKSSWEKGYKQEDVHALFLFITNKLNSPKIRVQVKLLHDAKEDEKDTKIEKDMCLSLCIPEQNEPIQLEELLTKYFDVEVINNLNRRLCSRSSIVPVSAVKTSAMLPFYYCSINETEKNQAIIPASSMVIPLLLMRYTSYGDKNTAKIEIPLKIDFSRFINKDYSNTECPMCLSNVEYIMFLRSGICHKGVDCKSGHYISYSKPKEQHHWYRLDDLDVPNRIQKIDDEASVLNELGTNGYLLFYELYRICSHSTQRDSKPNEKEPSKLF